MSIKVDISTCVPALRRKYNQLETQCASVGLEIVLTCTDRLYIVQLALYAQGRETLEMVNHLRANAGMGPIGPAENKYCVTWTLDSKHIINDKRSFSEAFDIALRAPDGKIYWDTKADVNKDVTGIKIPDYLEVSKIGQALGLRCGAFFKKPDMVHYELA